MWLTHIYSLIALQQRKNPPFGAHSVLLLFHQFKDHLIQYDIKQSTNDSAIAGGMEKFRNPGVGESVLAELKQVYRSTPQITAFLRDLDASFPAMDLEGEYATYVGASHQDDGDVPSLDIFPNDISLVDAVFEQANKLAREIDGGGSQVAVLCLNEALFESKRDIYPTADDRWLQRS